MKKVLCALLACVFANLSQAQWQPDLRLTNDPGAGPQHLLIMPGALHQVGTLSMLSGQMIGTVAKKYFINVLRMVDQVGKQMNS